MQAYARKIVTVQLAAGPGYVGSFIKHWGDTWARFTFNAFNVSVFIWGTESQMWPAFVPVTKNGWLSRATDEGCCPVCVRFSVGDDGALQSSIESYGSLITAIRRVSTPALLAMHPTYFSSSGSPVPLSQATTTPESIFNNLQSGHASLVGALSVPSVGAQNIEWAVYCIDSDSVGDGKWASWHLCYGGHNSSRNHISASPAAASPGIQQSKKLILNNRSITLSRSQGLQSGFSSLYVVGAFSVAAPATQTLPKQSVGFWTPNYGGGDLFNQQVIYSPKEDAIVVYGGAQVGSEEAYNTADSLSKVTYIRDSPNSVVDARTIRVATPEMAGDVLRLRVVEYDSSAFIGFTPMPTKTYVPFYAYYNSPTDYKETDASERYYEYIDAAVFYSPPIYLSPGKFAAPAFVIRQRKGRYAPGDSTIDAAAEGAAHIAKISSELTYVSSSNEENSREDIELDLYAAGTVVATAVYSMGWCRQQIGYLYPANPETHWQNLTSSKKIAGSEAFEIIGSCPTTGAAVAVKYKTSADGVSSALSIFVSYDGTVYTYPADGFIAASADFLPAYSFNVNGVPYYDGHAQEGGFGYFYAPYAPPPHKCISSIVSDKSLVRGYAVKDEKTGVEKYIVVSATLPLDRLKLGSEYIVGAVFNIASRSWMTMGAFLGTGGNVYMHSTKQPGGAFSASKDVALVPRSIADNPPLGCIDSRGVLT